MSHFAKVVNGVVTEIISADQSFIDSQEGTWIQTSYNTWGNAHKLGGTPLRGNYAGIGYTYDAVNDVFVPPKTYSSWVLNQSTWLWEAPTPYPTDDKHYAWDEETTSWKEFQ
jgi:hypothetical protein